jgi:hypothetical protein
MTTANLDSFLEPLYNETINKLKEGKRPQIKLNPEHLIALNETYLSELKNASNDISKAQVQIKKILCLLDNMSQSNFIFKDALLGSLTFAWSDPQMYIYTLSAAQKHICEDCLKTGTMIPFEFFESLKTLLKHSNPEVKEWTLRTITSLGPLSLRLKNDVINARPHFFQKLNAHQKACDQLIEFLINEWSRIRL